MDTRRGILPASKPASQPMYNHLKDRVHINLCRVFIRDSGMDPVVQVKATAMRRTRDSTQLSQRGRKEERCHGVQGAGSGGYAVGGRSAKYWYQVAQDGVALQ